MPVGPIVDGIAVNGGCDIGFELMSVERLPVAETRKISKERLSALYMKMITETFNCLKVDVAANKVCFDVCVEQVCRSNILAIDTMTQWKDCKTMISMVVKAAAVSKTFDKTCVIPAPQLIVLWAALNVRRLRVNRGDELSNTIQGMEMNKHIVTAIRIFPKHQRHFFVQNALVRDPKITDEKIGGFPVVHAITPNNGLLSVSIELKNRRLCDNSRDSNGNYLFHKQDSAPQHVVRQLDRIQREKRQGGLEVGGQKRCTALQKVDLERSLGMAYDQLAMLQEMVANLRLVVQRMQTASDKLARIGGNSPASPRKRQKHFGEEQVECGGDDAPSEPSTAQYSILLQFFRTVSSANPEAIKEEAAKFCESLGVSNEQKEQLLKVLEKDNGPEM